MLLLTPAAVVITAAATNATASSTVNLYYTSTAGGNDAATAVYPFIDHPTATDAAVVVSAADAAVSVSVADALPLPLPLPQLLLILLTPLLLRYRSFIVHYCLILISPPSLALSKPDVLRCCHRRCTALCLCRDRCCYRCAEAFFALPPLLLLPYP